MTLDTLEYERTTKTSRDYREKYANWQDANNWYTEVRILMIDLSFEEREMTDSEVEIYNQAMNLPIYSGLANPIPFRE